MKRTGNGIANGKLVRPLISAHGFSRGCRKVADLCYRRSLLCFVFPKPKLLLRLLTLIFHGIRLRFSSACIISFGASWQETCLLFQLSVRFQAQLWVYIFSHGQDDISSDGFRTIAFSVRCCFCLRCHICDSQI